MLPWAENKQCGIPHNCTWDPTIPQEFTLLSRNHHWDVLNGYEETACNYIKAKENVIEQISSVTRVDQEIQDEIANLKRSRIFFVFETGT